MNADEKYLTGLLNEVQLQKTKDFRRREDQIAVAESQIGLAHENAEWAEETKSNLEVTRAEKARILSALQGIMENCVVLPAGNGTPAMTYEHIDFAKKVLSEFEAHAPTQK